MILGLYWAYNAPQTGRIKVAYSKTQRPAASRKASWGLGARSSGPGAFFNPEGVYGSFEDSFQGSFRDSFKGSFWGFLLGFLLWRVFFFKSYGGFGVQGFDLWGLDGCVTWVLIGVLYPFATRVL